MEPWQIWTLAGLALIVLEMFTLSFWLASFGAAALITAAGAAAGWQLNHQLALFAVAGTACFFLVRPFFNKFVYRHSDLRTSNAGSLVGQPALVVVRIGSAVEPGRVKVWGEEWRAIPAPGGLAIEEGASVEIAAVDGTTLTVRPRSAA